MITENEDEELWVGKTEKWSKLWSRKYPALDEG